MIKMKYLGLSAALLLTSCNDYLDVVPTNDVKTVESVFEQRKDVYNWFKTCYYFLTGAVTGFETAPGYLGADELVGGQYARELKYSSGNTRMSYLFIGDGLQKASEPYGNIWSGDNFYAAIRYCNIFIEQTPRCYNMTDEEKTLWIAEIKALKAHFYFELMRRYGPIILVPKNIDANSSVKDMQQPRQPIDSCVNAIVQLCDEAIKDLPYQNQKERTRICYYNKEAAATLKAYTLLYAASPLFNGNVELKNFVNKDGVRLFPDYDREKWKRAAVAADEAIAIAKEAGKGLVSGTKLQSTELLNKINDLRSSVINSSFSNNEVLLALVPRGTALDNVYVQPFVADPASNIYDVWSKGCLAPSMKMVEMFYTDHGLPLEEDKQWMSFKYNMSVEADGRYKDVVFLNTNVLSLHRHREPRFYADIAADKTYWYGKSQVGSSTKDAAESIEMLQGKRMGTNINTISSTHPQSLTGYWLKKFFIPDNPLYKYSQNQSAFSLSAIVFRLPELYLMSAEAWNEYLDRPNDHVYEMLDVVRVRAGIPPVREAWNTYAKNPGKVNTQAGMRDIIRQEWNIEFAFEGRRFWNLRRWKTAADELNEPQKGWNVVSNTDAGFYNNYNGPIDVWTKRSFSSPRDYFFPIRAEEILISGVKQNPGWGN